MTFSPAPGTPPSAVVARRLGRTGNRRRVCVVRGNQTDRSQAVTLSVARKVEKGGGGVGLDGGVGWYCYITELSVVWNVRARLNNSKPVLIITAVIFTFDNCTHALIKELPEHCGHSISFKPLGFCGFLSHDSAVLGGQTQLAFSVSRVIRLRYRQYLDKSRTKKALTLPIRVPV